MRVVFMAGLLAAATTFAADEASAAPLTPTIEVQAGLVASVPVTTGSVSIGGVTVNGVPVVGTATQSVLQVNGTVSLAPLFNPLSIAVSEFNLSLSGAATQVAAAVSGTLSPQSTLSWSVYLDSNNNPLGTGTAIASGSFFDPSDLLSVGFLQPIVLAAATIGGPFALTELLTISGPPGATVTFNSSATVTPAYVAEPGSLALLGSGLVAIDLISPVRRRVRAAA